jgi:hypothetical protein
MSTRSHTKLGHDGRPSLSGYHLADQSNTIEKWYDTATVINDIAVLIICIIRFAPPAVLDTFEAFHLFDKPGPDGQPPNRHKPKMTAELVSIVYHLSLLVHLLITNN